MLHMLPSVGPLAPCQEQVLSCRLHSALGTAAQLGPLPRLARYLAAHPSGGAYLPPAVPSVTSYAKPPSSPGPAPRSSGAGAGTGHPIPVLPHTVWGLRGAGRASWPVPGTPASSAAAASRHAAHASPPYGLKNQRTPSQARASREREPRPSFVPQEGPSLGPPSPARFGG